MNKNKSMTNMESIDRCLVKRDDRFRSHFPQLLQLYQKYGQTKKAHDKQKHSIISNIYQKIVSKIKQTNQQNNNDDDHDDDIILLQSLSLIDHKYGQQLLKLIKPLQNNKCNYRDPKFVIAEEEPKPKLQNIINQIQHYSQYTSISRTNEKTIPINSTPALFSLNENNFLNEINGLLYKDNIKLYSLIGDIFIKFIPMFECCLNIKLNKYSQLSVIIKIQDYKFNNVNEINGRWHSEGDFGDNIIGVGIYYFDITENNQLKFDENRLEIAERDIFYANNRRIAKINVNNNDCIVFKNSDTIKHRAVINTKPLNDTVTSGTTTPMISRKMLTFFLMDPNDKNVANHNANDFKFINFPWKVDIFFKHFLGYNMCLYDKIPPELILLIKIFTFGDEQYLQFERTLYNYKLKAETKMFYNYDNSPFRIRTRCCCGHA